MTQSRAIVPFRQCKHLFLLVLPAFVTLCSAAPIRADDGNGTQMRRWGFGPVISTLGVGADGTYQLNPYVGFRAGGNILWVDFNTTISDIDYDADLELQSIGGAVDIYPFGNGFRLTGGLRYIGNSLEIDATPRTAVKIGSQTFQPSEVGTLRGDLEFNDVAPYVGLGFTHKFWDRRLQVGLDLGMLYQGSPSIDLTATGTEANDPDLQSNLQQESDEIEDDLSFLAFYPVLAISLLYRF